MENPATLPRCALLEKCEIFQVRDCIIQHFLEIRQSLNKKEVNLFSSRVLGASLTYLLASQGPPQREY